MEEKKESKKSERLSNIALGFSVFALVAIIFIEVVTNFVVK